MRAFPKFMFRFLLAGILAFLIVPMVIPFQSSGTLTNVEAAGPGAEFASLNGLDVRIETRQYQGASEDGVPLFVLMHGFGANTFSWRFVIDSFSKHGEVIAYDRPGFGYTERPTSYSGENPYGFAGNFALLTDLISKYGKGHEVILVGHSAGGQLAAEYARLNPGKVQKLILVDPAVYTVGAGANWFNALRAIPQIDKLGPFLVQGVASSGKDLLERSYYDKSQLTDEVAAGYFNPLKINGWERGFWEFTTASRENDLVNNLKSISQPTLLVTGQFDEVVPTEDTKKLKTEIKNSSLAIISNSGHLPQEEQPEAFNKAVSKWLSEVK